MNLTDHASTAAPALVVGDGPVISYAQLHARSRRVAALLHEAGLRRGDGVALLLPNRPEFLEITWGCQLSGLYYTPVNTHLTFDEVAYVVDDCEARAVFVDSAFADLAGKLADSSRVLICVGGSLPGWRSYLDALAAPARISRRPTGARCCIRRVPPADPRRYAAHCRPPTAPGLRRFWRWR